MRQVTHVLLTRPPLDYPKIISLDLHVLGTPPAFVLSQDQTLNLKALSQLFISSFGTNKSSYGSYYSYYLTSTKLDFALYFSRYLFSKLNKFRDQNSHK